MKRVVDNPIDKIWLAELKKSREQIWSETFWYNYKPDFDFHDFFWKVKDDYYDVLHEDEKKIFTEVFNLIEKNGFKLDIDFLESMSIDQKKYLSRILFGKFRYYFNKKFASFGKSLFIWIYWWKECHGWDCSWDRHILSEIAENFEWFDVNYFRQACHFLSNIWDKNIFHVLQEYNLIKNIDNDIKSPEIWDTWNLWEDFSLWVFHAKSDLWYWREVKYWMYELDVNWQETKLSQTWEVSMLDSKGIYIPYAYVLDRNDESSYKDASWESYNEYLDSPTWIALFYKDKPVACISFYIKNWKELFINQIQKVVRYNYDRYWRCTWKHYSKILDKIDWKWTLYTITTNLAKKYNISRIVIQWWDNNRWIKEYYKDYETDYFRNCASIYIDDSYPKPHEVKPHLDPKIAREIYDAFAEKQWFQKGKNWNREKEI